MNITLISSISAEGKYLKYTCSGENYGEIIFFRNFKTETVSLHSVTEGRSVLASISRVIGRYVHVLNGSINIDTTSGLLRVTVGKGDSVQWARFTSGEAVDGNSNELMDFVIHLNLAIS